MFDYGCGRGDDLRLLRAMDIRADGWDPVHRHRASRRPADIVNLGFVLNVIEDSGERKETLRAAYDLAGKVLIISVMLGYKRQRERFDAYQDGVRTARNTFQKYYAQDEFRAYVESALDARPIPVAPGICLVFRDAADEQLFLLARQQVRREWRMLRRDVTDESLAPLIERCRAEIDAYWRNALEIGRPPIPEECPATRSLAAVVGSSRRVHEWVSRFYSADEMEAAALGRHEDLLVYFALGHFDRRKPYADLPPRLQRDVRFFFRNITKARAAGKRALFATGNAERLAEAAVFCHEELGIGRLADGHDLTFHQSVLGDCLPLVRIFVGCALQLFADAGAVDLVKVHLQSGKVTFLVYDDFEGDAVPKLVERIKVDLPRLRVDFFDYVGEFEPQPLDGDRAEYFLR